MAKSPTIKPPASRPKNGAATHPDGRGIPRSTRKEKEPASSSGDGERAPSTSGRASGKQLVIVESPAKAKTINKYLGADFVVMASVGHVRDLPEKNPKGNKSPVPGVDLEHNFAPTYQVLPAKAKTVSELKRAAKAAREIWFATDLDREGEAIAWHLAEELGIDPLAAKRVMFAAITKDEIQRAFGNPHPINMDRVYAQQARRLVDRIVGYQVSPLLWKKVARGLSAGRVQSVAVRLVVEREREIRNFIPDEFWNVTANFALSDADRAKLGTAWSSFMAAKDDKGNPAPPSGKAQLQWLSDHTAIQGELVEVKGQKFEIGSTGDKPTDLTAKVRDVAQLAGLKVTGIETKEDERGKGPAKFRRTVRGTVDANAKYAISSIETKRTSQRPAPPFITSTLQQAASTRLGFGARRTMQAAQGLYEGVDVPGEGPVGLITYMRTDSTHVSGQALSDGPRVHRAHLRARSTCPRSPTSSLPATRMRRKPTRPSAPHLWISRPIA